MNAMTKPEQQAVQGHDSEDFNTSSNPSISDVIEARLSRRSLFKAGFGTAGTAVLGSVALTACGGGSDTTGEITSLQGPQQVTIVDASGGSSFAVRLPRGVRVSRRPSRRASCMVRVDPPMRASPLT